MLLRLEPLPDDAGGRIVIINEPRHCESSQCHPFIIHGGLGYRNGALEFRLGEKIPDAKSDGAGNEAGSRRHSRKPNAVE